MAWKRAKLPENYNYAEMTGVNLCRLLDIISICKVWPTVGREQQFQQLNVLIFCQKISMNGFATDGRWANV